MSKILFLDDNPFRHREMKKLDATVDHVYNANEALKSLQQNSYDLIMLDHDLNEDPEHITINPSGEYVAVQMGRHMKQHIETPVVIHSLNPAGAKNMRDILEDHGYMFVHTIPFAWNKIRMREGQPVFER